MTVLYFNGDSFVAGDELADDIIPEYPGLTKFYDDDNQRRKEYYKHIQWVNNTYNENHYLYNHRKDNADLIFNLKYKKAFPAKVQELTNLPTINHALSGSSMDRISRTSIIDLYKLRKSNINDKIVAFIGTTAIERSSIANFETGRKDFLNFDIDYICISKTYNVYNDIDIENIRKYKILNEKNYHDIINFYENIAKLQYFCEKNNIQLHFISAYNGIDQLVPEIEYVDRELLLGYKSLTNFKYTLNMKDYINYDAEEICPSGHFGEPIHDRIAIDLVKIIESIV